MLLYLLAMIDDESDREFFEKLFTEYEKKMWFKANEILHDEALAEDAVQNTFLKIAKKIKYIREINEACIWTYLSIAAGNSAKDIIKKINKEIAATNEYLDTLAFEDELSAKDERDFILYVLDQVPGLHVDVMRLYFLYGCSQKEIATLLDMNINTVRQHVSRGRRKFIELYNMETEELNAK